MGTNLALNAAWNVADYLLQTGLITKLKDNCIWVSPMPTPKLAIQRRRKSCAKNVSRSTKTPGSKEENLIAMNLSVECTSILTNVRNH